MDIEKDYNIYWILLYLEFLLEFLACAILPVYIIAKKKVLRTYLLNELKNILNWELDRKSYFKINILLNCTLKVLQNQTLKYFKINLLPILNLD